MPWGLSIEYPLTPPPSPGYGLDYWRGPLKQEYFSEGLTEKFMHTLWGVLKYTYIHNRVEYLLTI